MNVNEMFPSNYLKASDIKNEPIVTISKIERQKMKNNDGEEEVKPVIFFQEYEKGVVLNRTNANTISAMYGDELDDWIGKRIQLHTPDVEGFGRTAPAIRVKSQKPPLDKQTLMTAYTKLWEKAKKLGVEGVEDYVINPSMTEQEITDLGKELKAKVQAAEAF